MTPALFAAALLRSLALPETAGNIAALVAAEFQEGGHDNGAAFNPLNTTWRTASSRPFSPKSNVQAYSSWDEGLEATRKTLLGHPQGGSAGYADILGALNRSAPPEETIAAFAASPWGWYDARGQRIPPTAAYSLLGNPSALAKWSAHLYRRMPGAVEDFTGKALQRGRALGAAAAKNKWVVVGLGAAAILVIGVAVAAASAPERRRR